jgi:hypothetical protein
MDIKYLIFESQDYSGDALMELYQLPPSMCVVINWNNTETYAELLKRYPADRHRFVWPSQSYKSQRDMYRAERRLHGIEGNGDDDA